MTFWEMAAVLVAGIGAGTVNTIVGSGSLITFPVLLAVGYAPVLANVSNTVGLTPGGVAGAYGYRAELVGQGRRLITLGIVSVIGGAAGALLLLKLPAEAFRAIVPALIGLALVLVLVQPRLAGGLAQPHEVRPRGVGVHVGVLGSAVYGGYFGAAQGVLLIAIMGLFIEETLQRINAAKNVLAALVNATATVVFLFMTEIAWAAAGLIAVGSVIGGLVGASAGRRIPSGVLRAVIVVVGFVAIVKVITG